VSKYLLIESQDCFESPDANEGLAQMEKLSNEGHEVAIYLVQNSVLSLRKSAHAPALSSLLRKKVQIFADDFSLDERGITGPEIMPGIQVSNIETLIDLVMEKGRKAIWH
jgi:hypothetical protein